MCAEQEEEVGVLAAEQMVLQYCRVWQQAKTALQAAAQRSTASHKRRMAPTFIHFYIYKFSRRFSPVSVAGN